MSEAESGVCNDSVRENSSTYARSINLPTDPIFRNLKNATRFAVDIGGSLAKLAYSSAVTLKRRSVVNENDRDVHLESEEYKGIKLEFIKFETKYLGECLDFIRSENLSDSTWSGKHGEVIKATGGGAHKYTEVISEKLGFKVDKEDEISCLIKGCNFLLQHIPNEVFLYQHHGNPSFRFQSAKMDDIFPYLLVNIGSGVSIIKVESDLHYERIGGTSMGGGTFWGLGSLLTKAKGFDDLLRLAEGGDHRGVDLLVKDIYGGGGYRDLGLPQDLIASSFGKAARSPLDLLYNNLENGFNEEDVARSLLITISNDIGQIACLNAKLHGLKNIYFGGYFIRGHPITMHTITYAINYWSKGEVTALFLRHEGYLGAIGAFLKGTEEEYWCKYSWGENYAGSSGLRSPIPASAVFKQEDATVFRLELDQMCNPLTRCPLLHRDYIYIPDTVDLTLDHEAREHWIAVFISTVDKVVKRASDSQKCSVSAAERAVGFRKMFMQRMLELKEQPCLYGSLTMRSILDLREDCLSEFSFPDIYEQQKLTETEEALVYFSPHMKYINSLSWYKRQEALAEGLLAGNVFDWGAKEVAQMLEAGTCSFERAKSMLHARPWLVDDFDRWTRRLEEREAYRCAAVFVDNSGLDVVLGIFPFAVELLTQGTRVLLCANSKPTLNDITYSELVVLCKQLSVESEILSNSLQTGQLEICETGSSSPCINFMRISSHLNKKLVEYKVDLIVLEGMGRAIHTNYEARFLCDTLKVAVLKDRWFAKRLGGDMFSTVFKFEEYDDLLLTNGQKTLQ